MLLSKKWGHGFLVVLVAGVLSACGGGGGGGDGGGSSGSGDPVSGNQRPASPEASLTIDGVKTFRFDWADVASADTYKLLENPDGMSGFTPVGEAITAGAETLELAVPLYARVNAQYILQACNEAGCADSDTLSVSGNLVSGIGYFKASNTDAGDSFGSAVSLSADGQTLAVGAIGEDSDAIGVNSFQGNNPASEASGAVYVFAREANRWSQQAYLKAGDASEDRYDYFGSDVSLSADGDTLAVSAMGKGVVYVFSRNAGIWKSSGHLKANKTGGVNTFGASISLSADGFTLVVGASTEGVDTEEVVSCSLEDNNSVWRSGAVYVFARADDEWSEQAYLKSRNAGCEDFFGWAVSVSADGDTLAVGAIGESSNSKGVNSEETNNSAPSSGAVYVFTRNEADTWSQQAYLKASNAGAGDYFGFAVSLSADGSTLAVGARDEDSAATGVHGDQNDDKARDAGAVYVFARETDTWSQQAYVKASNAGVLQYFGAAVSLGANGDTLAVGAHGEGYAGIGVNDDQIPSKDTYSSGAVFLFTRVAGIWEQQSYLKAGNADAMDNFGYAVSLSADGDTLAVGAHNEDSATTGVNEKQDNNSANSAGAVYLY